jgi:hypothetical protein
MAQEAFEARNILFQWGNRDTYIKKLLAKSLQKSLQEVV